MDKKFNIRKNLSPDDIKGFEEFINADNDLTLRPVKNEASFEHFTFLSNDADRLLKTKGLLMDKIPFATKYEQAKKLNKDQAIEIEQLKKHLFEIFNQKDSSYRKSLSEIFDSFYGPPKI